MKTLAYDCGNPVQYVCGRMPAVLFLFTGSPRSFHSLAMTKGTKWLIPQSLTTPAASRHPSNGGELGSSRRGVSYPLRRMGVLLPSRRGLSSSSSGGGRAKRDGGWVITRILGEGWFITSNESRVTHTYNIGGKQSPPPSGQQLNPCSPISV